MPLDGNGLYTPPAIIFPVVATEIIYASDFNSIINDIASALSSVVYRDGQAAMTGALPMGTKRITGMADAIADTDAVTKQQLDDIAGGVVFDVPSGTVMVFYQAAAPFGWTQSTAHNDKALRVVAGVGGGSGGTHGLTAPPSQAHAHAETVHVHVGGAHTHGAGGTTGAVQLTESQIPSHTHNYTYTVPGSGGGLWAVATTATGGNGAHEHSGGGTTSSAGAVNTTSSAASNTSTVTPDSFLPKYIDVIICVKD
jgi:hypothetical protein